MSSEKKLMVVGDGSCGKTSLLIAFDQDTFYEEYAITLLDKYDNAVEVDGETIKLSLWDTGSEDFGHIRPSQYPQSDVVLICFSVVRVASFHNVAHKWWPEVRRFSPGVPILLVGTKNDLREDPEEVERSRRNKERHVSREEAEHLAEEMGAIGYVECSAKTRYNVDEVFVVAARTILSRPRRKKCPVCELI